MDKEKLQKEIVDAISQIAKNEARKNSKITIVKGEITGVDPLNCYYNFSYNNHLYSARSVLGGYSVGQKVFIAFSGEQENNIVLCGEIIGGGTVAGSEEKVLSSIVQQYYISNSSEIEPPQNPGEGAQYQWSDTKLTPTEEAPYLWTRYKYIYTDASIIYTTPYVLNLTEAINESNETITDYIDSSVSNIQNQIDKQADIWFYNGVPSLNTYPANEWTTDEIKDIHIGDLYFDTSETSGKAYEFKKEQSTYLWKLVQDQDVIKALNDAARAQDTADNKRRVFYSTPIPPYDKGDLWVQGSNGDILYCNTPKESGATYSRSDWVIASKYTDDSNLNIFKEEYTHYKEDNDQKWENTLGKITTIEGQVKENTSSIQQNADNITLRAQETTELKNNLETNYYTKEQSDAAIKVSSDAITSTVSSQISSLESNAIKTTVNYYLQNNGEIPSKTDPSWSTSQPSWVNGKHIWLKVKTTKIDGSIEESDPVDLTGASGENGAPGENGIGIVSVTPQYYQSSSYIDPPGPDVGWTTTQPAYKEGQYIWVRYDTLLDNKTHSYSTPVLDQNLNDVYEVISTTKSEILQTTDSITSRVEQTEQSVKTLSSSVSEIKQTSDKLSLSVEQVQHDVDNLNIANTNLLTGTRDLSGWIHWPDGTSAISTIIDGFNVFIPDTSTNYPSLTSPKIESLKPNTQYTLSYMAEGFRCEIEVSFTNGTVKEGTSPIITPDSTYKKYTYTFTTADSLPDEINLALYINPTSAIFGAGIYAPKIELGVVATEWAPSYDDNKEYVKKAEITLAINDNTSGIKIKADRIALEGITTINDNFIIDKSGSLTAKNAKFSGTITGSIISGGTISGTNISGATIKFGTTYPVTMSPNSEDGVKISGTGQILLDTTKRFQVINRNSSNNEANHIVLYDDGSKSSAEMYNRWNGTITNYIDLESNGSASEINVKNKRNGNMSNILSFTSNGSYSKAYLYNYLNGTTGNYIYMESGNSGNSLTIGNNSGSSRICGIDMYNTGSLTLESTKIFDVNNRTRSVINSNINVDDGAVQLYNGRYMGSAVISVDYGSGRHAITLGWNGSRLILQVDATFIGYVNTSR